MKIARRICEGDAINQVRGYVLSSSPKHVALVVSPFLGVFSFLLLGDWVWKSRWDPAAFSFLLTFINRGALTVVSF